MDSATKAAVADAVNTLIGDSEAKTLYMQMQGVLEVAARGIPVQLVGRPAVLNPLIDLALTDEAAYERVMELIDRKRKLEGKFALGEIELDRRAYMREFMAQRRDRLRRLVELWNQLRSENDKIKGKSRLEFEQLHGARWQDEKTAREYALRDKLGRRLTMEERGQISAQIWEEVEDELHALEIFVLEQLHKPVHQRSKAGFQFQVGVKRKVK